MEDGSDDHEDIINPTPRNVVALEQHFNRHDATKLKEENKMDLHEYIEVNIGTPTNPKIVKIGKGTNVEERKKLTNLLHEYRDVLTFSCNELKGYREDVMEHTIPLKDENAKPFRQKLRQINPKLAPLVQKELSKMLAAGIIAQTRHSTWCSNLVIVRKKNGTIRLCVNFQNLNLVCMKDNYPLPNMETLLQRVTSSGMMSLLDGFSRYNQVWVKKEDRQKPTFTTPWGTFKYIRMSFGLTNVGATFQRAMDYAFKGLIGKFIEIYQDDLTIFSKDGINDISHLRQVFDRCREYAISLNPAKSVFGVTERRLLDHIIPKDGIKIDPERVEAIQKIPLPHNLKSLQSFLPKTNFLRRFIPNYVEIAKPIQSLLKKDVRFVWQEDNKRAFQEIKGAIAKAPILVSPNYSKDFMIFSFASEDTIVSVLLQKNKESHEQPIAFMSRALQNSKLKYNTIENQAYALVKSLKHFKTYVGYSKIIAFVPHSVVKEILTQTDCLGTRARWVTKIQEYGLEIRPTKLVKGQGLAQMLTEGNEKALGLTCVNNLSLPKL